MIEAIIAGEHNAANFLPLIDRRTKAHHETIQESLQGSWRDEHLFSLEQNYEFYKTYKQRIEICDLQIEKQLEKRL